MSRQTVGAIALQPTGNSKVAYYSFSLNTRKRINLYSRTINPGWGGETCGRLPIMVNIH